MHIDKTVASMTPELQTAINVLQIYASVVEDAIKLQRRFPSDSGVREMAIRLATRYHDKVMERHGRFVNSPVVAKAKRLLAEATAPALSAEIGPLEIVELMPPHVGIYESAEETIA